MHRALKIRDIKIFGYGTGTQRGELLLHLILYDSKVEDLSNSLLIKGIPVRSSELEGSSSPSELSSATELCLRCERTIWPPANLYT
jgi:hypothetical protein